MEHIKENLPYGYGTDFNVNLKLLSILKKNSFKYSQKYGSLKDFFLGLDGIEGSILTMKEKQITLKICFIST
jgi:hypothetical protein